MKRLPAILALCLWTLPLLAADGTKPPTAPAAAKSKLGKWEGFRGIKWGTTLTPEMEMVLLEGDPAGIAFYGRKTDKMTIGKAALDVIAYGFYRGRFYAVDIFCKGYDNGDALASAVFARYGKGHQPNEFIYEYHWNPKVTPGRGISDVGMILRHHEYSPAKETKLMFLYMPLDREHQAELKKAAQAAAADF